MKKPMVVALALLLLMNTTACVSMRPADNENLRDLQQYGIKQEEQAIKNPGVAGALNVLPGFGNFYLATGTDESSQWAIGFLNLLAWPISVVWGIPEAAIDASTINKKETVYYYMHTAEGKKALENRKATYLSSTPQESDVKDKL